MFFDSSMLYLIQIWHSLTWHEFIFMELTLLFLSVYPPTLSLSMSTLSLFAFLCLSLTHEHTTYDLKMNNLTHKWSLVCTRGLRIFRITPWTLSQTRPHINHGQLPHWVKRSLDSVNLRIFRITPCTRPHMNPG
jgi:hypothetical protein